jgi:hypothetical protein
LSVPLLKSVGNGGITQATAFCKNSQKSRGVSDLSQALQSKFQAIAPAG